MNFHLLANSIPSANVPTRASMAYPCFSREIHSFHRSFNGTENVSMNSLSSRLGCGLRFSGRDKSIVTWTILRLVLQKPGSVRLFSQLRCVVLVQGQMRLTIEHDGADLELSKDQLSFETIYHTSHGLQFGRHLARQHSPSLL